jgi:hypothetical protein
MSAKDFKPYFVKVLWTYEAQAADEVTIYEVLVRSIDSSKLGNSACVRVRQHASHR